MAIIDYITLNQDWKADIGIGLLIGTIFIILNLTIGITIGFPNLPQATEGERIITVGIFAPFGEELWFRAIVYPILNTLMGFLLAMILSAIIFALFHAYAYAGGLSPEQLLNAQGAFIGAGIFGIVAVLLVKMRKSFLAPLIAHSMFNIFLVARQFVVVG